MRRDRNAFVWLVASALLSAACGRDTAAWSFAPHGTLVPSSCPRSAPSGARCSTLSVYENRDTRAGRLIALRIVVLPARGPVREPDPVFFLAGGPGQAATWMIGDPAIANGALGERRDVVLVDQRGTGGSNGLTCDFYGPPSHPQSYFAPFMPPEKVRECRLRLSASADLTQYTTENSVADLDDVRAALGYERINLIGGSYGTRLAMEYVRRHEAHVRSVVVDGVVVPDLHIPENFGIIAQQALDALLDECASVESCASAFPSIRAEARAVFDRLAAAPARARVMSPGGRPVEVRLTKAHVAEAIRYMTYSSHSAARVPLVLHQAYRGDYSPIAEYLYKWRSPGTFDALYLSITCTEDVPFVSPDAEARESTTFMAGYRVREQRAACEQWPRGAAPDWIGRPVTATVPVLLFSGALDPVTPPGAGEAVARTLSNSLHVEVPFGGHAPSGLTGLECLDALQTRFVETASVVGLDTSCIARIRRPGFATRP
jgi:pimeloyl-ACP methyl ester carboxylesterase